MLLLLSSVGGFLTSALDASDAGHPWDWRMAALTSAGTFAFAVASYVGGLKGSKLSLAAQSSFIKD